MAGAFTVAALAAASWYGWKPGALAVEYSPELAVLTLTVIAVVWYAAFAYLQADAARRSAQAALAALKLERVQHLTRQIEIIDSLKEGLDQRYLDEPRYPEIKVLDIQGQPALVLSWDHPRIQEAELATWNVQAEALGGRVGHAVREAVRAAKAVQEYRSKAWDETYRKRPEEVPVEGRNELLAEYRRLIDRQVEAIRKARRVASEELNNLLPE